MNKNEKEQLVIKLHEEGQTIRNIAQQVHMSFKDIGIIIRRIEGQTSSNNDINLSNKSKTTQAFYLFKNGKKPIEVAIELDLSANEIEDMQQEYWILNQIVGLALAYQEIKNNLDLFLRLFHAVKKNRLLKQKETPLNQRDKDLKLSTAIDIKLHCQADNGAKCSE